LRKIIVLLVGIILPTLALAGFPEPEVVATNLVVPWALAFAPDGRIFFTERGNQSPPLPAKLRVINADGTLQEAPVIAPPDIDVFVIGEGGLMGLEIDPDFVNNGYLYIYYTTRLPTRNNLVRLVESGGTATVDTVLLDNVPANTIHDGGRIKIGPDGMMYVTTGNAFQCGTSQDLNSLAGKILRLNLDGTAPEDNPFYPDHPLIYSLGHRNPQGLAWDASGQLYETEHGPTQDCGSPRSWYDEVNIIFPTGNYGWPICWGPCDPPREEFIDPLWWSLPPNSQPPTGAAFYALPGAANKSFLYGMMGTYDTNPEFYIHARQIHYLTFADDGVTIIDEGEIYHGLYGRIREVIVGPDGYLYFTTSNRDGRYGPGVPPDDDKIFRVQFNSE
jgi:glucose/arabinose dehydrogenase